MHNKIQLISVLTGMFELLKLILLKVILKAGSVMYFPAGYWHQVECTEDSISMNISLIAPSWADLVSDAVHHLL